MRSWGRFGGKMDPLIVISVVRDFAMYDKCLARNPFVAGCERVVIDNREKNETIPVLYNRFLKTYDFSKPAWFMFCHEDFEPREHLVARLDALPLNQIYGPVGAITVRRFGLYYQWRMIGQIEESKKDGKSVATVGRQVVERQVADTLDCQCLLVHSSLLERTRLRFDENLSFDLYVEDFCMTARELHDISSVVIPLKCHHWSKGCVQKRYFDQLAYLNAKWPKAAYTGTACQLIGGGGSAFWRAEVAVKRMIQHGILLSQERR